MRRIDSVHLHHTHMPNVSLFESLADSLGTDEAAGQELCKRMWRYHTVDKGWSEIAQHVTVDPVGRIWLGRPFDRPPVSAKRHNGSYASGPLMIEMIGHFDRGAETMSDVQRNATLEVIAAIMNVYKLPPSTSLRFHSEMSTSSCPGTFLDKDAWISDLEKRRKAKEDEPKKKSASVGTSLESDQTLLLGLFDSIGGKRSHTLDDSELLAEPPESDMSIDENGGATQLASRIMSLQVKLAGEIAEGSGHAAGPIRFNAVGHSAGAIFHAHFVNTCVHRLENGLQFDDVSLLAPACTIELFREKIKELLDNGKIDRVNLFCLDRDTEANDHTVPFYGKSLLHLVSDGFESKAGTPVLGMERYILADESMRQMLGFSGTGSGNARLILSPSGSDDDEEFRSDARIHGGFGRDFDTLRAVAMSLREGVSADLVPPFSPRMNSTRGNDRLFMKLDSRLESDVLRLVRGEVKDTPVTVAIETTEPGKTNQTPYRIPTGSRTALCIGIDKYQEGITPLHGCVNDAKTGESFSGSVASMSSFYWTMTQAWRV